jgi:hypothetical protein
MLVVAVPAKHNSSIAVKAGSLNKLTECTPYGANACTVWMWCGGTFSNVCWTEASEVFVRAAGDDGRLSHVEAGSNTFTVALWIVEGDEKGPSAWGYSRATLFLGDINLGTLSSKLGESRIWKRKIWSRDLRMTALAMTSSICKRHTHPFVREDVT